MSYNYFDSVKSDVMEYINNEINLSEWKGRRDELEEKLNEDLWTEDSVTGNGSGSYTFSRYLAQQYVIDNIDDLADACAEFCIDSTTIGDKLLFSDWEWMDVTIRCYYLGTVIIDCLDDLANELEEADDEENAE